MPQSRPEVANFAAAKGLSPKESCGMRVLGGTAELRQFRLHLGHAPPPLLSALLFL